MDSGFLYCQQVWNMLNDGGTWGVPRSGLMYRKDEPANKLVLYSRIPWDPEIPGTPELLRCQQELEHDGIRKNFEALGIEVTDET